MLPELPEADGEAKGQEKFEERGRLLGMWFIPTMQRGKGDDLIIASNLSFGEPVLKIQKIAIK